MAPCPSAAFTVTSTAGAAGSPGSSARAVPPPASSAAPSATAEAEAASRLRRGVELNEVPGRTGFLTFARRDVGGTRGSAPIFGTAVLLVNALVMTAQPGAAGRPGGSVADPVDLPHPVRHVQRGDL